MVFSLGCGHGKSPQMAGLTSSLLTALAGAWHPWMEGEEIADAAAPIGHHVREDLTHW